MRGARGTLPDAASHAAKVFKSYQQEGKSVSREVGSQASYADEREASYAARVELPMLTSARWSTSRARTSRPARTLKPLGFRFGRLQASYASLLVCLLSYCPLNVSKAPSCGSHASHAEARSSLDRVFSRIICREDVQTARVGLQASHACGLRYSRTHGVEPMAASEGDG